MTEKEYIKDLKSRASVPGGKASMSDEELLALLLADTNCKDRVRYLVSGLVSHFGTVRRCFTAPYAELMTVDGMTRHAAVLIMLVARAAASRGKKTPVVKSSDEYSRMFIEAVNLTNEEEMWAVAVNDKNKFTAVERIAIGSQIQVGINISSIISFAGRYGSKRIIIAHSHPDIHNTELSHRDNAAVEYIVKTFEKFGIKLLGQIVISGNQAEFFEYKYEQVSRI